MDSSIRGLGVTGLFIQCELIMKVLLCIAVLVVLALATMPAAAQDAPVSPLPTWVVNPGGSCGGMVPSADVQECHVFGMVDDGHVFFPFATR